MEINLRKTLSKTKTITSNNVQISSSLYEFKKFVKKSVVEIYLEFSVYFIQIVNHQSRIVNNSEGIMAMIGNSQGIFETSYKDEIARVSMDFLKLLCYVV